MLSLIVTLLKIIPVSIILAVWFSWIKLLGQLMRERPWDNSASHRLLSLLHPTFAKIAIIIVYLITGLIGTVIAVVLLRVII